ncbi:MAG: zinc-ribbon domain-containing protein [Chloroflexota bacterium]|nr:zinc-ribbon domain-containing protein [Chloroflexota bacterium]
MPFCPRCGKVGVEGMEFCPRCGKRLTGFDSKEKQGYVYQSEATLKEKNWFERHLNWAMVLASLGAFVVNFIIHISYGESIGIGYLIIPMAILALVWGWTLRKKNRSLWWLPLGLFVPFGFIVLLCLDNRSQTSKPPELQG